MASWTRIRFGPRDPDPGPGDPGKGSIAPWPRAPWAPPAGGPFVMDLLVLHSHEIGVGEVRGGVHRFKFEDAQVGSQIGQKMNIFEN